MKHLTNYLYILSLICLFSCEEEKEYNYQVGNPTITLNNSFTNALFGDSLQFNVDLQDNDIPLSTLKVELYFTDDKVSETIIRTKQNGTYNGKIFIPFLKNIPNGTATLKFILQNISQKISVKEIDLPLSRPNFPYLELITNSTTYKLQKVEDNKYAITQNLPYSVNGYIQAPKVGTYGNIMNFGWVNNEIQLGSTADIPFSYSSSTVYTINFNTLTYEASPFIVAYAVNGTIFSRINDNVYRADINLNKGDEIKIDGIADFSDWWIDNDFFKIDQNKKITSNVIDGKYRITANFTHKYLIVEAMSGNNLASLNSDGTGAVWIIGDGIGKPNVSSNHVGWNTDKALCMAPIGNKRYQITVTGKVTAYTDYINFKFFHQKGWGGEFTHNQLSSTSDIIFVGNGSNGRDSGNLGLLPSKLLEENKSYVLTVDLSEGNSKAKLTVNPI